MPNIVRWSDKVAQRTVKHSGSDRTEKRKKENINWNEWWPFTRATGDALKQLNRRQRTPAEQYEEALL